MIACLDVDYRADKAVAAFVSFSDWADPKPAAEVVAQIDEVAPYQPGQFYRRELPCLMAVLKAASVSPEIVVIDGYVWLGDEHDPGLGAYLYEALGRHAAVIGVAKTKFLRASAAQEVLRGGSRSPLYVTAVGINVSVAARHVQGMHGPYRVPTLLKRADQLCRGHAL